MALVVLNTATSTMDVAKEMLRLGQVSIMDSSSPEPGGVMALEHTAGRGQRGRTWYSVPGESLCVTYFVPLTDDTFQEAGHMAILAGAAVANALEGIFGGSNAGIFETVKAGVAEQSASRFGLKWPNDLVMSQKKLGGILVETVPYSNTAMVALIGVGINVGVQQFPPALAVSSTSLAIEDLIPDGLLSDCLLTLANSIRDSLGRSLAIQSRYGFKATIAEWRQYDTTIGRRYRTETANGPEIGVAVEVNANGALVVRTENGELLTVLSASATTEL